MGMLTFSRHSSILRMTVMLCVGLSFILSNQGYIALMDRAQHVLHQEHAPNPLAGRIEICAHAHDESNMHHHCDAEDHAIDSSVTHQHLDSSIVYIVSAAPDIAASRQTSFVSVAVPQELDRMYAYRLERPPKTFIASYA
jgi:hypothetical protein